MNILYINHYAGSIKHGMEYRPYYLAREWVKLGYKVTIVASQYSHLRQLNVVIPNGQNYVRETIDGIDYIWCRTKPYKHNGLKRLANIFEFLFRLYGLIPHLVKLKPSYVIASSTYPFDTILANKIAKKTQAKFIYEVHDLWPLTPMELGGMSRYHPFIWLMQRAENYGYKKAKQVVSLLPCAKEYMMAHGMQADKFIYVPNGISCDDWGSYNDNISQHHQNIINCAKQDYSLVIGYAGGMSDANALEYLIAAAIERPQVAFILVGDGVLRLSLINQVKQSKLSNVFILPAIKKPQIPQFLKQMDVLYIGWHKLPIYRFGISPNKLFDYMLSARPILHSVTAGNDLVLDANCGISVAAEDVMAITQAIDSYQNMDSQQRDKIGSNGCNYVVKYHDYKTLAAKFLGLG